MKKFLSLMLAMIMVMSLVTVGAGAVDFEAEEIQQVEAAALLYGLEIVEGQEDGTFNPKGTINRGAATKIITRMLEGKAKADAIKAAGVDSLPFSDEGILNSSNAAYIAYCVEKGIVSGRSDGTFRRYDGLTGNAFLKMVLVALGVKDIDFNSTTNPGWPIDAQARATEMGLLDGIDEEYVYSTLLTREDACQIAFNAMVNYTAKGAGYVLNVTAANDVPALELLDEKVYPSLTDAMAEVAVVAKAAVYGEDYTLIKDTSETLGAKVYGIEKVTGTVTANAAIDSTMEATQTEVEGTPYNFASGLELIGHEVTVYFNAKPEKAEDQNVYAVIDNSQTLAVTTSTTLKTINAALEAKKETDAVKFGDLTIWSETYAADDTKDTYDLVDSGKASNKAKLQCTLIITDKAVTGIVMPVEKTLTQVVEIDEEDADEKTITLKGFSEMKNGVKESDDTITDVVNEYEGVAEDDYVIVTLTGDVYNLEKATIVTGKPTKIDTNTITINGTAYGKYVDAENKSDVSYASSVELTEEITLYVGSDGKYIVRTTDKAAAVADIVYVADAYKIDVKAKPGTTDEYGQITGATKAHSTYFAQIVTLAGETAIYPITTDEYDEIKNSVDTLYKVTLEKGEDKKQIVSGEGEDAKYVEAKFADFDKALHPEDELFMGANILSTELKATAIKLGNDYFADDVTFVWVYGNKDKIEVVAKSGVQALDKDTSIEFVYSIDEDSQAKVIEYVIVEADPDKVEYTGDVIYVVKDSTSKKQVAVYTDEEGEEQIAYEHEIYVNGEKTKVVLDSDKVTAGFKKMTAVVDGVYKLETLTDNVVENAKVTGMYKGLITIDGVKAEDIDVAGVQVVDTTSATTKITDATKITTANEVSVVLAKAANSSTNSIVTIYITK